MYTRSTFNYTKEDIDKKVESLLSFFSGYSYTANVASKCDTNGLSIYVVFSSGDKSVKVRFSDHPSNDRDKDYFNGSENILTANKIGYLLGVDGFVYKATSFKVVQKEYQNFKDGQHLISTRVTKRGNILYMVEFIEPNTFMYLNN